jgi:hypothetical protein
MLSLIADAKYSSRQATDILKANREQLYSIVRDQAQVKLF